jgi:hypothetical protein
MAAASFRALVRDGRLVLDEPTDLPEGTVVDLVPGIEVDNLDDAERERLHGAIRRGLEQGRQGESRPVDEVLAELRTGR